MRLLFWRKAPSGSYVGRLAFDSDSGFHIDPNGFRVLTEDGGQTWRYAVEGDLTHQQRYHQRSVELRVTTSADAHHVWPTEDDPHFSVGATDPDTGAVTNTRVTNSPDSVAVTETSHTEAYRV